MGFRGALAAVKMRASAARRDVKCLVRQMIEVLGTLIFFLRFAVWIKKRQAISECSFGRTWGLLVIIPSAEERHPTTVHAFWLIYGISCQEYDVIL